MTVSEDQRIEIWNMQFFLDLGFSGDATALLLSWGTDPHDAENLLYVGGQKNGRRTACEHATALALLRP